MDSAPIHPPECVCLEHAIHPDRTVREARDAYLLENGFTLAGYDAERSVGSLFGLRFSVPNPPAHRRAIRLHDLLHVATGFGTDHRGEGEISAFQLRRGVGGVGHAVAAIVVYNVLVGLLVAPRGTIGAFVRTRPGPTTFDLPDAYESLLELRVGELRERLGLPLEGISPGRRGRHALAP